MKIGEKSRIEFIAILLMGVFLFSCNTKNSKEGTNHIIKDGQYVEYDSLQLRKKEVSYLKGKKHGYFRFYNRGVICSEFYYHKGVLLKEVRYSSYGAKIEEKIYDPSNKYVLARLKYDEALNVSDGSFFLKMNMIDDTLVISSNERAIERMQFIFRESFNMEELFQPLICQEGIIMKRVVDSDCEEFKIKLSDSLYRNDTLNCQIITNKIENNRLIESEHLIQLPLGHCPKTNLTPIIFSAHPRSAGFIK